MLAPGADFSLLFDECRNLDSINLSSFYCWTDDIPPALESHPTVASNLTTLNLLNPSFAEGFKAPELDKITRACPNLKRFLAACMFDPRYVDFVGDESLVCVSANCPKLSLLHLADTSSLLHTRADPDNVGMSQDDAGITLANLIEFFSGLPLLEDLALDVCNNVRDSGPALEMLNSKCPKLRSLKLGMFHGISLPVESQLDGVALCQWLECLSIRNVADLTDMGLIAIARGCSRLAKFEVEECKKITVQGMRTFASLLQRTLVDVKISCCKNLGAVLSLRALEPIQDRIQRLHIDCVWDSDDQFENLGNDYDEMYNRKKKCKYSCDPYLSDTLPVNGNGNGNGSRFYVKTWEKLRYLSLWFSVGELLTPLASAGLEDCPNLEEIWIKVEGDCRNFSKPPQLEFGLNALALYGLSKMHLDCGDTIGYTHTAPSGQMDLSLWERFYLLGIGDLRLTELDYWPPQDRDVNQRSLSLPAAGLLQQCGTLRKLFIHGTAHEHFMMFLLKIPTLRDVQLREDYYPAPENDMSTEMRAGSCSRFEDALNLRSIED